MKSYKIEGKRINKFTLAEEYKISNIQIGIPIKDDEAKKVGLINPGDIILPSASFGTQCSKNAYGYAYADKTKEKENRYISTNWIYPYGNTNASQIAVDIYRPCYPKVIVLPYEIELQLYLSKDNQQYVIANLTDYIREKHLKDVVNIFLEIYGVCYIFEKNIAIDKSIKKRRCNWEILPKGQMPSKHLKMKLYNEGERTDTYSIYRLECIEKYGPKEVVEGINGFKGYYAYIYDEYCVLESALYGNATYIIPAENWEELSQKTKKELLDEGKVVDKIVHTSKWKQKIDEQFKNLEITQVNQ